MERVSALLSAGDSTGGLGGLVVGVFVILFLLFVLGIVILIFLGPMLIVGRIVEGLGRPKRDPPAAAWTPDDGERAVGIVYKVLVARRSGDLSSIQRYVTPPLSIWLTTHSRLPPGLDRPVSRSSVVVNWVGDQCIVRVGSEYWTMVRGNESAEAVSATADCPHCGAPRASDQSGHCRFCGAPVASSPGGQALILVDDISTTPPPILGVAS